MFFIFICDDVGRCQRCRNSAYLLNGQCLDDAKSCAAFGKVAVGGPGDSPYGRTCIQEGGICRFASEHSCRSPKALGACVASRIERNSATCLECDETSWLVNGWCRFVCSSISPSVAMYTFLFVFLNWEGVVYRWVSERLDIFTALQTMCCCATH